MREKAYITHIDNAAIWVVPLISDACISCTNTGCVKKGKPFITTNPRQLNIRCGDIVRISASVRTQALQSVISLLVPILAAAAGYFLAGILSPNPSEAMRAAGVLAGFFITAVIIYCTAKRHFNFSKSEITEILYNGNTLPPAPRG